MGNGGNSNLSSETSNFLRNVTGETYTNQLEISSSPWYDVQGLTSEFWNTSDGVQLWLVNDVVQPTLEVEQNKWYRLHITNTVMLYMFLRPSDEARDNCEFLAMSQDGVRSLNGEEEYEDHTVVVPPAGRLDLGVKCTGEAGTEGLLLQGMQLDSEAHEHLGFAPVPQETVDLMTITIVADDEDTDNGSPPDNLQPLSLTSYLQERKRELCQVPLPGLIIPQQRYSTTNER